MLVVSFSLHAASAEALEALSFVALECALPSVVSDFVEVRVVPSTFTQSEVVFLVFGRGGAGKLSL